MQKFRCTECGEKKPVSECVEHGEKHGLCEDCAEKVKVLEKKDKP